MKTEMSYEESVKYLHDLKNGKAVLETKIKKVTREILDLQQSKSAVLPLSNQGGERTVQGVTYEIKRSYEWDSDLIENALSILKTDEKSLPFIKSEHNFKVDMRQYKDWAMMNPKEALIFSSALATKLGNTTIKKIDLDKLNKKEEED
tara:strand:- start:486 stop:929 length:444 start_codon:yes stop_codon:yes gene_type:complete